jgi:hypothetical protein
MPSALCIVGIFAPLTGEMMLNVDLQLFDFEYLHVGRDDLAFVPALKKAMNALALDFGVD